MDGKSRQSVSLLLKSLEICSEMEREGVYVPAWDLVEAYQSAARARSVLEAMARHILTSSEPDDAIAAVAVLEINRLKEKIVDAYPRASSAAHAEHPKITRPSRMAARR